MKRLALLLALLGCIVLAVPASAHNLYRKPKVGVTGDIFTFKGTKWQPNAFVYWEYFFRPRDNAAVQDGRILTGRRGRFKLLFRDFNLGRHRMCFMQIDTRFGRISGFGPNDGRFFRECKRYRVFGTDF